jgi:hypothetical protein
MKTMTIIPIVKIVKKMMTRTSSEMILALK